MTTQIFISPASAAAKKRVTKREKAERQVAEAQRVTADLLQQVREWVAPLSQWVISEEAQETGRHGGLSANRSPVAVLDTPKGRLLLEPLGLTFGGRAVVEFYAYPSSYRVRLLHELDNTPQWRVRTDSGIYLREEWNRDNFLRLAGDLLAADWD